MESHKIENKTITFDNGIDIGFRYTIQKSLSVDNLIIILLEIPSNASCNQNVFALTNTGDYLWQIGKVELFYNGADCPYIDMNVNSKNQLVLFNWCDTAVIVDINTGDIIDKYITK